MAYLDLDGLGYLKGKLDTTYETIEDANDLKSHLNDVVIISDTEPSSEYNKIWIDSEATSVQVPTVEDVRGMIGLVLPESTLTDQPVASFDDGANNIPVRSLVIDINPVQTGSGDPSPTNVRAISGWTGMNGYNDPKYAGPILWNQLGDFSTRHTTTTSNGVTYTYSDGAFVATGTATANSSYAVSKDVPTPIGNVFYVAGCAAGGSASTYYCGFAGLKIDYGNGGLWKNTLTYEALDLRIDAISGTAFPTGGLTFKPMVLDLTKMFGSTVADQIYAMEQSEAGSGVTYVRSLFTKNYYEYNAGTVTLVSAVNDDPYDTITVSWQTTAGTVYGGTLDVATGVLTVLWASVDMGTLTWTERTGGNNHGFSAPIAGMKTYSANPNKQIGFCSVYKYGQWHNGLGNLLAALPDKAWGRTFDNWAGIVVRDDSYNDYTTFTAAMSGVQFVYDLATPVTYQLTPKEVDTYLGSNNIWADTGNVNKLIYRCDIAKYIDNKLSEA